MFGSKTKYIVVDSGMSDDMHIFPSHLNHNNVADKIGGRVISAGFLSIDPDKNGDVEISCYGKSISLNVDSRPEIDTYLAYQTLGVPHGRS